MNAIEVSELTIEYKRWRRKPVRAVDALSFRVMQGEVVGFLGVNGAGKTSTIKALMGFQPPTAGKMQILGLPVGHVEARRQTGFLPETALYSPYLTPFETLRLYGELHGLSGRPLRVRIEALLESVGVIEKINIRNRNLSKGMLQRVGIAQALGLCYAECEHNALPDFSIRFGTVQPDVSHAACSRGAGCSSSEYPVRAVPTL